MRVLHFTTEGSMPIEVDDCKVPIVVVLGVAGRMEVEAVAKDRRGYAP
jgi:hypothetical protein